SLDALLLTALRILSPMPVFGLETIRHSVPFQCSARLWLLLPTLQMSVPLIALPAFSENPKPLGPVLSPGTCSQDAPFHFRINTCPLPPAALKSPTAHTLFAASAVTPSSRLLSWLCVALG